MWSNEQRTLDSPRQFAIAYSRKFGREFDGNHNQDTQEFVDQTLVGIREQEILENALTDNFDETTKIDELFQMELKVEES